MGVQNRCTPDQPFYGGAEFALDQPGLLPPQCSLVSRNGAERPDVVGSDGPP
jgi:hypothetical protein